MTTKFSPKTSFESGDVRGVFERGLLPIAIMRVRSLLHESLPDARTIRQIYDHALEHWPVELQDLSLLERACEVLVSSAEAAENRVLGPERVPRQKNWLKGYKAIELVYSFPDVNATYCNNLSENLSEVLQCLAEEEPGELPFVETMRYLIPRKEIGHYIEFLRGLREAERVNTESQIVDTSPGINPCISAILVTFHGIPVNI